MVVVVVVVVIVVVVVVVVLYMHAGMTACMYVFMYVLDGPEGRYKHGNDEEYKLRVGVRMGCIGLCYNQPVRAYMWARAETLVRKCPTRKVRCAQGVRITVDCDYVARIAPIS